MDTSVSSSESMAEANTATEPLNIPTENLTSTSTVATEIETSVARFAGEFFVFNAFLFISYILLGNK